MGLTWRCGGRSCIQSVRATNFDYSKPSVCREVGRRITTVGVGGAAKRFPDAVGQNVIQVPGYPGTGISITITRPGLRVMTGNEQQVITTRVLLGGSPGTTSGYSCTAVRNNYLGTGSGRRDCLFAGLPRWSSRPGHI
eukprot:1191586-Rhodomonas_salina.2